MGQFIIPLQQAPPHRRHLRSPTSPSHLAFRIHTQHRCSTPPAAAWLISHQALYFSYEQPISHVAQECFTSDSVNLWKIARRRCSAKWRKIKLFTFKEKKRKGAEMVPLPVRGALNKTNCSTKLHEASVQYTMCCFLMKMFQVTTSSCTVPVNTQWRGGGVEGWRVGGGVVLQ